MNICEKIQFELTLLDQDETLSGSLERHLKDCAGCRHFAAELSQQEFQLRALIYPCTPDWASRIESIAEPVTVVKFAPHRSRSFRRESLFGKIAVAVALSASLMVGVVGWLARPFFNGLMPGGPPMVARGPELHDPAVKTAVGVKAEALSGDELAKSIDLGKSVERTADQESGQEAGQGLGDRIADHAAVPPADGAPSEATDPEGRAGTALAEAERRLKSQRQTGAPSPAGSRPEDGFNALAANSPMKGSESRNLVTREGVRNEKLQVADPGFLDQLQKAEKPETKVRMVLSLCQQQYERVLVCLDAEDPKKRGSQANNQLTDDSKSERRSSPEGRSRAFDSDGAGKASANQSNLDNGGVENLRGALREKSAENVAPGRMPGTIPERYRRDLQAQGDLNLRAQGVDPWEDLLPTQGELTDYKIRRLRETLPSPSNDKDLKPLMEELKKQQRELLRLASVHPARAKVLNQLAEMTQKALAVLEKPADGKAK